MLSILSPFESQAQNIVATNSDTKDMYTLFINNNIHFSPKAPAKNVPNCKKWILTSKKFPAQLRNSVYKYNLYGIRTLGYGFFITKRNIYLFKS